MHKGDLEKFQDLTQLEPRLLDLRDDARKAFDQALSDEDRYMLFRRNFKRRVTHLVGWSAGAEDPTPNVLGIGEEETASESSDDIRDVIRRAAQNFGQNFKDALLKEEEGPRLREGFPPELRTSDAYDVVYHYIYDIVVDGCRE